MRLPLQLEDLAVGLKTFVRTCSTRANKPILNTFTELYAPIGATSVLVVGEVVEEIELEITFCM